jgi:hypothetical protein
MNALLVSSAISWVTGFFENKREIGKAVSAAKIENANKHIAGWGDEFLIMIWSYPFISMFIPYLRPHTAQAFAELKTLPEWYIAGFMSITLAVFGMSKFIKFRA